jgi:hypothetical protein
VSVCVCVFVCVCACVCVCSIGLQYYFLHMCGSHESSAVSLFTSMMSTVLEFTAHGHTYRRKELDGLALVKIDCSRQLLP